MWVRPDGNSDCGTPTWPRSETYARRSRLSSSRLWQVGGSLPVLMIGAVGARQRGVYIGTPTLTCSRTCRTKLPQKGRRCSLGKGLSSLTEHLLLGTRYLSVAQRRVGKSDAESVLSFTWIRERIATGGLAGRFEYAHIIPKSRNRSQLLYCRSRKAT